MPAVRRKMVLPQEPVYLRIKRCDACPHVKIERYYTGDSFEMVFIWKCAKTKRAKEIGLQEGKDYPLIPAFCPLRRLKR